MEPVEDETFNIYIINFPMHEVYFGWLNWTRGNKKEKRKNTIYELHPPKERERGNSERFNKGNQRRLRKRERNRQIEIAKKKKGVRERLWLRLHMGCKRFLPSSIREIPPLRKGNRQFV